MTVTSQTDRIDALAATQRPLASRLAGLGLLDAVLDEPVADVVIAAHPTGQLFAHRKAARSCTKLHPVPFRGDTVAELFAAGVRFEPCATCLEELLDAPSAPLSVLRAALELDIQVQTAGKPRLVSPVSIRNHLRDLGSAYDSLESRLDALEHSTHPAVEYARATLAAAAALLGRLRERLVSAPVRASTERVIRRALLGGGREHLPLDDQLVFVGVSPPPDSRVADRVLAALQVYEVWATDTHVVAAMPMFVYTWVARSNLAGRKDWSSSIEAVVPGPGEDAGVGRLRVAGQLWDPSSSAPLGSLRGAYLAASTLDTGT